MSHMYTSYHSPSSGPEPGRLRAMLRMLLFAALMLGTVVPALAQTTWYVNDNSSSGDVHTTAVGATGNPGTSSAPFLTMLDAYNAAAAGDIIQVDAGVYGEVGFALAKAITIRGAKTGIDGRTRGASEAGETVLSQTGRIFDLNTSNITLDGLYFRNLNHRGMDCYANANSFTIRNCVFNVSSTNTSGGAIQFGGGSDLTANNFLFEKNLAKGSAAGYLLYFLHSAADGQIKDNTLNSKSFMFGPFGQPDGWLISGNLFDGTINGVDYQGYPINAQFGNALVTANTLRKLLAGFQISVVNGSVTNNVFDDNRLYGIELWGGSFGSPVSSNVSVSGNTFNYNGMNPGSGLYSRGLRLGRTSDPAPGMNYSTISVNNNSFTDLGALPGIVAVEQFGGTGTLNATCNWWNATTLASIGAKLNGSATFTPWLISGTDSEGSAMGFQPAAGTCTGGLPVQNTTQGLFYSSIQAAIDAATANDVITVAAGTYTESVVINKTLDIRGANYGVACGSRGSESVIAPSSGLPVNITADGVTLNGFEITAPSHQYAILCGNRSNLSIAYNNIHDINSSASPALTPTHAIQYTVANAPAAASNVSVTDNCISNVGSAALTGNSATAMGFLQSTTTGTLTGLTIARNTISSVVVSNSAWPTGKIAYGIQLNAGGGSGYMTSTGKIVDAVIADNVISGLSGHIATGIALEGNTQDALVTGNSVSNLSATKLGNRAGGGLDLNGLKFENNKFVSTCTVTNNSFATNTFSHSTGGAGKGYAIANYVPEANGGVATVSCNWLGTTEPALASNDADLSAGQIFNKLDCSTVFNPWIVSGTDNSPGTIGFQPIPSSCSGDYRVFVYTDQSGTVLVSNHVSIQSAINAAPVGSLVQISAGTYTENLTVNKRLTIDGAGSASTIVTAATAGVPTITISGSGSSSNDRLVIRDMKVTGATGLINVGSGILVQSIAAQSNITIENVDASWNGGPGIAFNGTPSITDVSILNCALNNNANAGIRIASAVPSFDGLLVDGCTINNNASIAFSYNPDGTVSNVGTNFTLSNTTFSNNSTAAVTNAHDISFFAFRGNGALTNVTVTSGNGTQQNSNSYGIVFDGGTGNGPLGTLAMSNVTVQGHVGKGALLFQRYTEISGVSLNNVDVSNCVAPWGQVILSHTDADEFSLGTTTLKSLVHWTTGRSNATLATFKHAATNAVLDRNVLTDCFQMENQMVHATDNSALGFARLKDGEVFVTATSGSVQRGISVATVNDVLHVGAGTYNETVTLGSMPLTLRGANFGVPGSGTRAAESVVTGGFVLNASANVIIDGFSVTGSNNVAGSRGILLGNTSVVPGPISLNNNIIENWTTGISLGGGNTPAWVSNVTVSGNLIHYNTAGLGSTENVAGLVVTNNTFSDNVEGVGIGTGLTGLDLSRNAFFLSNTVAVANYAAANYSATCNWWGQASGPAAGQVTGAVSTIPYLTSSDLAEACDGFPPVLVYSDAAETNLVSGHTTIQAAINAATTLNGYVVRVQAGTFTETVTVNKELDIRGANYGVAGTDTRATESVVNGSFVLSSSLVSIDGFEITGSGNAVGTVGAQGPFTDVSISHNRIVGKTGQTPVHNGAFVGSTTLGSARWTLANNYVANIQASASTVFLLFNIDDLNVTGNVIEHTNASFTGRRGVSLDGSRNVILSGNTIDMGSSLASQTVWSVLLSMSDRSMQNITITNNTFLRTNSAVIGLSQRNIEGVTATGNVMTDVGSGFVFNTGGSVWGPADPVPTMSNITITNNTIASSSRGVHLRNLWEAEGPVQYANVVITNNSLVRSTPGAAFEADAGLQVVGAPIDATCNWYGSGVPADVQTRVAGNALFTPYLTDGTDDDALAMGFQPVAGACDGAGTVVSTTPPATYFSIGSAIAGSDNGATITVGAGSYRENVVVDKPVTLLGNNAGTPLTACGETRAAETVLRGNGVSVEVTAPSAATYAASFATDGWGYTGDLTDPAQAIVGEAVLAQDGVLSNPLLCDNPNEPGNVSGKIAVVYRGTCEFSQKAINAQNGGAIGVIIINNVAGVMALAPGAFGASVTIPVLMISNTDGAALRAALDNGTVSMAIGNNATAITIASNGASVSGFELQGNIGLTSTGYTDLVVTNNKVNAISQGIVVGGTTTSGSDELTITGNAVTLSAQAKGTAATSGIVLASVGGTAAATVSDNAICGGFYGYVLSNVTTSPRTVISGGSITGVMQGVSAFNSLLVAPFTNLPMTVGVDGITMSGFTGNVTDIPSANFHAGVYIFTGGADNSAVVDMTVNNVDISGTGNHAINSGGLYFADFSTATATQQNVTVTNSHIHGNLNRGVNVRGLKASATISNSDLIGNGADGHSNFFGRGVFVSNGAQAVVSNCNIVNPATGDVYAINVPNITSGQGAGVYGILTVEDSNIDGNGNPSPLVQVDNAAPLSGPTASLTATCNWWGSDNNATVQAAVTGNVSIFPFLTSGMDDDAVASGFQPEAGACNGYAPVSVFSDLAETTLVSSHTTIQAAIDAATTLNGYVVRVAAGTYAENVTVNKALDIRGANYGVDPNTGSRVTETVVSGTFSLRSSDISVNGFEVIGAGAAFAAGGAGPWSNVSLTHNRMIGKTGQQTVAYGFSLGNVTTSIGATNWSVSNNRIEDIQALDATAMALFNITVLTVSNNVILHTNATFNGRRGMNLDGCQDVTVSGNTVDMGLVSPASDNSDGAFTKARYPLQLSASAVERTVSNVTVNGNTMGGAYDGIITLGNGVYDGITIINNEIANNVIGIRFQAGTNVPAGSQSNITIENNSINTSSWTIRLQDGTSGGGTADAYANVSITNNSLVRSTTGAALEVQAAAILDIPSIDATNNYWGGCPVVSGPVTFYPYYASATGNAGSLVFGTSIDNISASASPATVCAGQSSTLTGGAGSAFSWSDGLGVGTSKTVNPTATTTYSVTGNDLNGCALGADSVTVTVAPAPTVTITMDGNTLTASGADSYQWSTGETTAAITVNPVVSTTYSVIGTTSGCTGTASTTVQVIEASAGANQFICNGSSATLTASPSGLPAASYAWSGPSGFTATGESITVNPPSTSSYTVTINGSSTASVTVFVRNRPTANAGADQTLVGGTATLNGSASGTTAPYSYAWSGPAVATVQNPVVTVAGTYSLVVSDAFGCQSNNVTSADVSAPTANTFTVSGNVKYQNNLANQQMHNVQVRLVDTSNPANVFATTTPATGDGNYSIANVPNGTYTVYLASTMPWGGVTATDISRINGHITGRLITNGIFRLAADVDANSTSLIINTADRNLLNSKRLTPSTLLPTGNWIFTRAGDINQTSNYVYAHGGITNDAAAGTAFSNITITVNGANVSQDFRSLCYGDVDGTNSGLKNIEDVEDEWFDLMNFPNPFNSTTTLRFTLPVEGDVYVEVFDLAGARVATMSQPGAVEGTQDMVFDASGLAGGMYLYRLTLFTSDDILRQTNRMLIAR